MRKFNWIGLWIILTMAGVIGAGVTQNIHLPKWAIILMLSPAILLAIFMLGIVIYEFLFPDTNYYD